MKKWKDIKGFEGLYQVSDMGEVKSLARNVTTKKGSVLPIREKILFQTISKIDIRKHLPRAYVQLWKNNKSFLKTVHRLVAIAFIENTLNKPTVNHKDGNPLNNSIDNLEWSTYSENQKHAYKNGLVTPKHPFNQITCKKVIGKHRISGEVIEFDSVHKASRFLGVTVMAVSNTVRRNKKSTGFKYACMDYEFEYK